MRARSARAAATATACLPATRLRQSEAGLRPALRVADHSFASVSTHHGPDDREAEPATAVAAAGAGAAETLECAWQELGRKARTQIAHPDLDALISIADIQGDRAVPVAQRVIDDASD